jgi:hypothetical protein
MLLNLALRGTGKRLVTSCLAIRSQGALDVHRCAGPMEVIGNLVLYNVPCVLYKEGEL